MDNDLKYWLALSRTDALTPLRFRRLIKAFGSAERIFCASRAAIVRAGIPDEAAEKLIAKRSAANLDEELARLRKANAQAIPITDPRYPPILREIHDPPPVLYVRGALNIQAPMIAIVGTRAPTPYGRRAAEDFSAALACAGVTVVSGLALGIDAVVHAAALRVGGETLAVLGSGVDVIAPTTNTHLAERMFKENRGAVLSEYPLGTEPRPEHFPARNRIISGLSLGTIVIEGSLQSGALITAKSALEQNREVFALPGSVYSPMSAGPNALIKLGAHPVQSPQDVLEMLGIPNASAKGGFASGEQKPASAASPVEAKILAQLGAEPRHVDAVARGAGLDIADVSAMLTLMEIQGRVRNLGAMTYALTS
jgi:DNA processing protein